MNEKRIKDIKTTEPLTNDMAVIVPNTLLIECLISQLKQLMLSITRFDTEIKAFYNKHADKFIFDSLPGAGPQLAPRLLAAMGSNRDRYQCAAEIQKYAGIATDIIHRAG
ncbi:transposase [Agaribacter marinus]|uniref:Transposase IS116/IS110/IS902 C-terminal domain-containing protein n=1 Tax=Agaribacter marinus TaxID=1431249 RepID=A0AA37WMC1_9ALTE|nr:transposase [Agaribacter marinus]GLR72665.1 hypothetical protein GCM10007852_35730 [Agaribacter marinus]